MMVKRVSDEMVNGGAAGIEKDRLKIMPGFGPLRGGSRY